MSLGCLPDLDVPESRFRIEDVGNESAGPLEDEPVASSVGGTTVNDGVACKAGLHLAEEPDLGAIDSECYRGHIMAVTAVIVNLSCEQPEMCGGCLSRASQTTNVVAGFLNAQHVAPMDFGREVVMIRARVGDHIHLIVLEARQGPDRRQCHHGSRLQCSFATSASQPARKIG